MQKDKNKETIDSSHLACQYYIMQCKKLCPTDGCAKHLSKCQNKCSKNCDHKKTCSEKVQKLKKKFWIRQGLNLQLSWLTTVCIRGFNKNASQLFPSSLYTSAFNALSKAGID